MTWSLFGHVLRLDRNTLAQLAMDYYSQVEDKGGAGRPVTTLPVLLFNEYKKHMIEKKNADPKMKKEVKTYQRSCNQMLEELRQLAGDRVEWRTLVETIASTGSK